ncbi:trypsin-like peptidase domain-containing protein [Lipingzhangella sp. LS1_29]|uniref:Trypsin-like peptidase domain-containing protein n=1 Tax=Lipingzhangella rawalii TaxID=2055835 RepID=A0ABU2H4I5_9ACTN|nr:trypsin-like peptidase domain-containing protein [Lipingzhangella rawalii]MDS1269760.1 trypsin-like peptidase domain-containing protein [Lipingzhangella rawalii]
MPAPHSQQTWQQNPPGQTGPPPGPQEGAGGAAPPPDAGPSMAPPPEDTPNTTRIGMYGGPGMPPPQQPPGAAPASPSGGRRRGAGIPLWAATSIALLVGLIGSGLGLLGGAVLVPQLTGSTADRPLGAGDGPPDPPSRDPDSIAGVAQEVSPSVVSIQSTDDRLIGNGSGFVVADGYIVTNNHVASGMGGDLEVVYHDGHETSAQLVGAASSSDLAVLEAEDPLDVDPLYFGDSDQMTVGDPVIAIGSPLGLDGTVTTGIISAMERPVTVGGRGEESYVNALQTDAAINPGNSGGPLVDLNGNVIGVNTAIATMGAEEIGGGAGNIGLGFAVPSGQAERIAQELIEHGEAPHAVMGVMPDLRYAGPGALIVEEDLPDDQEAVEPGGPADRAGLEPGDIITEVDGSTITDAEQLLTEVRSHAPGTEVEVVFLRDGDEHTVELTLEAADD